MSSAFPAVGMAHFIESNMTYIAFPMGVYGELMITRNILSCLFYFSFVNFIGHANSVPDGSSPRGYSQELVLGCRLTILTPFVAILSSFSSSHIFLGCATSATDGWSPCSLPEFLFFHHNQRSTTRKARFWTENSILRIAPRETPKTCT